MILSIVRAQRGQPLGWVLKGKYWDGVFEFRQIFSASRLGIARRNGIWNYDAESY